MINCCAAGCARTAGLAALSFCMGVLAGLFFPIAVLAVIEMVLLIIFGYLCLFKW